MDNILGLDLLTNPKKLKNKTESTDKSSSNPNKLVEEIHSPILIDNSIKNLINTLSELIKYRYHLRKENNSMALEIINELLPDNCAEQLKSLDLDF